MTDVVYVNRAGENPELRYSLRTLKNVEHDRVWVFGGAPTWINPDTVIHQQRRQTGSPYSASQGHLEAACNTPEVSDPFMLWNDDFFAMQEVGSVPVYHRGPVRDLLEKFSTLKTAWAKGLRETASLLEKRDLLDTAMSYDLHLPLIIHKAEMREAIRMMKTARTDAIHLRTLYGVTAGLGGTEREDVKMLRRSGPFPQGAWLSSGDDTFRPTVEPVLRYLFPNPSPYEKEIP